MATSVTLQDMERVLRPWLGTTFLASNSFADGLTEKLQDYAPYRQTLEDLRTEVERYIVTKINRFTGSTMQVMLDDYHTCRLTLQSVERMTDEVMGVLFDNLTPFSMNFEKLNDYALRVESLSAMRVLYQRYASFFSEEELHFLVYKIREIYPPQCYESWLDA